MKLNRIDLIRFGHLSDTALDLGAGSELHVVFGRNAAGKTTIAAAIEYALFDWPTQRSERDFAFRFPTSKLRIGTQLTTADGASLEFDRRKGRGTTVLDPSSGTASDALDARLRQVLRGMTRDQWRLRHGLTKERLREGGRALQQSGGDLRSVLAATHDGIKVLQHVLDDVVRRREAIDNGKQSGALVDAVREYEIATKDAKDASRQAATYGGDVDRCEQLDVNFEQLREQVAELGVERRHLEYLDSARGLVERWEELTTQIDEIGPGPGSWSNALHDRWRAATDEDRNERTHLAQDEPKLVELRTQLGSLAVDERLVALHDHADLLRQRLAQVAEARDQLPVLTRDVEVASEAVAELGEHREDAARGDELELADVVDRALELNVEHLRKLRTAVLERTRALEHRAAALPGCDLDLAGARSLALPAEADVAAIVERVAQIDASLDSAQAELARATEHIAKRREQLQALEADGELPSVEHLAELRAQRDAAWMQVRGRVLGEPTDVPDVHEAVRRVDLGMRDTDEHADRLAHESERAGQAMQLRRQNAADEQRQQTFSAQIATLAAERASLLTTQWDELWARAGVVASTLDAMQQFVREITALRAEAVQLDEDVAASNADMGRVVSLIHEFEGVLGQAPRLIDGVDDLTRFESLRNTAQKRRDSAASTRVKSAAAAAKLQAAERAHERARATLATFTTDVASLLRAAGTPTTGDVTPEVATAALTTLWQGIITAKMDAERHHALSEQVAELDARVRERNARIAAVREELDAIRECAGVADDAAVRALDAQWGAAHELIEHRRRIEDDVRAAVNVAVPELIALRDADDTSLRVRIDRIEERLDQLAAQQRDAKQARDELVVRIRELQTSTALVDANERRASARARVEELIPTARRLAVQEQMLRDFIEQHARESRGPLVQRAGEYFARITCGEFDGIDVDQVGDHQLVLVGVPANGEDSIRIDHLSEGTIDQLFLSLRLAGVSIERDAGSEPMPLIIDDVLASFDDERARATLVLLAELAAAEMQIIFLTHHDHLVELATNALDPGLLRVHRLDQLAPAVPA